MSQILRPEEEERTPLDGLNKSTGRRDFLRYTGAGVLAAAVAACDSEPTRTVIELQPPDTVTQVDTVAPPTPTFQAVALDFSSDVGVLNYAYALEQLEAAFYTMVTQAGDYATIFSADERSVLEDLRDHEITHREFFRAALGDDAIPALTPNFGSVNFGSRLSVLQTAQTLEDLGVAAYNGAGQFLESADFLTIAGKIVSVEARHAAAIRDILNPLSFAPQAFDPAMRPSEVLGQAAPFIRNQVTITNPPANV